MNTFDIFLSSLGIENMDDEQKQNVVDKLSIELKLNDEDKQLLSDTVFKKEKSK